MSNATNRWVITIATGLMVFAVSGRLHAADSIMPPVSQPTLAPGASLTPNGTPAPSVEPTPTPMPSATNGCPTCSTCSAGPMCSQRPWDLGQCATPDGCPPPWCNLPEYPLPTLYARFRALALMRDGDDNIAFAALGETAPGQSPNIVLSTNDVKFSFEAGGEALVGWMMVPTYRLEFSYFELDSCDRSANVRDHNDDLFSPFGDFGLAPDDQFDDNNHASIRYQSRLNNYELNLRHDLVAPTRMHYSFLFGGRAMQVHDNLIYSTESDLNLHTNDIVTRTRNRLMGLQVGGLFEFHCDPGWWINFEMKGGICQNDIDLRTVYTSDSAVVPYSHWRDEKQTSFVGELNLSVVYEFGPCLTAEAGYRALWITGLALGAENFQTDSDLLALGPPALNDDGQVVYHGPHVGLTARW